MQQLFYQAVVPVSAQRHRDLYVKTGGSFGFAASVNSVPLNAIEFTRAAAEYPIVFAGSEENVFPAVILGVQQDENLFVDENGRWGGHYVPAFVRRYPFIFSQDAEGKTFTLHIDEKFEGCNMDGRGERLFDADGDQTQYLRGVLDFLQDYQTRFRRTQAYCRRLVKLNLLQPVQAQFMLNSGERRTLGGFMTIDREKLKAIPAEDAADMLRKDEMECTFSHLASLVHFRDMLARATPGQPVAAKEILDTAERVENAEQEQAG